MNKLRVARPTDNLVEITNFYCDGLGMQVLDSFENHNGFDGIMLGHHNSAYHLEFTHHRGHTVGKAPNQDCLLVFYIPDTSSWEETILNMEARGYQAVKSYNPYWDENGKTFEDIDGYRVVLQNTEWQL
ncbi:VOC family protein [Microcoleus sp. bin38.metabat.b11b12b14.051]|uniref:VOC family protein n=1 Tax=Microcoleus sp. bin38.metabat.b11b12b14.051 TaxID=2742709 RepID=UPI0025FF121A|nr:VOC family protein [Microcoleus sp. bin38.metabat.b11b12b14.051]